MLLKAIGSDCMDWFDLLRDRVQWRSLFKLGSDPSGVVEGRKILDRPRDCQLLKKGSGPCNELSRLLVS
jgi:hypothetical protein